MGECSPCDGIIRYAPHLKPSLPDVVVDRTSIKKYICRDATAMDSIAEIVVHVYGPMEVFYRLKEPL